MDDVQDFDFDATFSDGSSIFGKFEIDFTTNTETGYYVYGSTPQALTLTYSGGTYNLVGGGPTSLRTGDGANLSFTGENPTQFDSGNFYYYNGFAQPTIVGGGPLVSSTISPSAVCFVTGARIKTTRGEIQVQHLIIGDLAVTATGSLRRIVWIGNRRLISESPVCIAAHAFGQNRPERDLWLSPGHPVLVGADDDNEGGVLVPIMCLINGTTIERVAVETITYWHVELDEHDILLAEGLPAESYIDLGSRQWFAGADAALLNPDLVLPGMRGRCRPVAVEGPIVEAERRRLNIIFAARLSSACSWPEKSSLPWTENSYP